MLIEQTLHTLKALRLPSMATVRISRNVTGDFAKA
jgi:hypothetical protein